MRRFGLIGRPLGHSASAAYFTKKFTEEGISDCAYALYELPSIDRLPALLAEVPEGTAVSVTEIKVNRSSTKQEVWYKFSYGGKTGWMASGYVKLNGNFARDLAYADTTSLANEFLQWHNSGGRVVPGLLYRRLAECKIFFFGNYDEGKTEERESPNYRKNTYGFRYPPSVAYLEQK